MVTLISNAATLALYRKQAIKSLVVPTVSWLLSIVVFSYSLMQVQTKPIFGLVGVGLSFIVGVVSFLIVISGISHVISYRFGPLLGAILSVISFIVLVFAGTSLSVLVIFLLPKPKTAIISPENTAKSEFKLLSSLPGLGSQGTDVRLLQYLLGKDKEIYPSKVISGYYGQLTFEAVKRFQIKYHLSSTGIMDMQTVKKIDEIYGIHPSDYYLSQIPTQPIQPNQAGVSASENAPGQWGESTRIAGTNHGWVMKVGSDPVMGTAQETFDALNIYRSKKGTHGLNWDGNLGTYAQQRVAELVANGGVDDHKGFQDYIHNTENRQRLGFYGLGENASCGYRMTGTHLIEWLFAGDAPHENNQLNSSWTDVGIGVSGTCITIIFGYDRMN